MIGKKAKITENSYMYVFKKGQIVTLVKIEQIAPDGSGNTEEETRYHFVSEDGLKQLLVASEFEFIEGEGE